MANLKYQQIVENIKGKIMTCELCPGDMLPSESAFSEEFQMSRVSVRKGLSILTAEGYVTPVAGKGYFVNRPETEKCILCFEEPLFIDRNTDEYEQIHFEQITADRKTAHRLEIEEGENVIFTKHLYYLNGKPVSYDIKLIPAKKVCGCNDDPETYVNTIDNSSGIFPPGKKELHIWAAITTEEDQEILQLSEPAPILVIEQILRNTAGEIACWSRMFVSKKYNLIAKS